MLAEWQAQLRRKIAFFRLPALNMRGLHHLDRCSLIKPNVAWSIMTLWRILDLVVRRVGQSLR